MLYMLKANPMEILLNTFICHFNGVRMCIKRFCFIPIFKFFLKEPTGK